MLAWTLWMLQSPWRLLEISVNNWMYARLNFVLGWGCRIPPKMQPMFTMTSSNDIGSVEENWLSWRKLTHFTSYKFTFGCQFRPTMHPYNSTQLEVDYKLTYKLWFASYNFVFSGLLQKSCKCIVQKFDVELMQMLLM